MKKGFGRVLQIFFSLQKLVELGGKKAERKQGSKEEACDFRDPTAD